MDRPELHIAPAGLCQCGCGAPTSRARQSHTQKGYVKGEHVRYRYGHSGRVGTATVYSSIGGYQDAKRAHVVVAERALGKALPAGAVVHHVDENGLNNAPSNLVICQGRGYHALLHVRTLVVRAGGDPNTQKMCRSCGIAKPFELFYRRRLSGSLLSSCIECNRAVNAKRYRRDEK